MPKDQSIAPKERVNLTYKAQTAGGTEERELPLKVLVIGDYTGKPDERRLSERKPININKTNFNEVMAAQELGVQVSVPNKLADEPGEEMSASLKFETMKDFTPEGIANQVPELQKLLELREALISLRAPLSNPSSFRKKLRALVKDDAARERLIAEVTKATGSAEPSADSGPTGEDSGPSGEGEPA